MPGNLHHPLFPVQGQYLSNRAREGRLRRRWWPITSTHNITKFTAVKKKSWKHRQFWTTKLYKIASNNKCLKDNMNLKLFTINSTKGWEMETLAAVNKFKILTTVAFEDQPHTGIEAKTEWKMNQKRNKCKHFLLRHYRRKTECEFSHDIAICQNHHRPPLVAVCALIPDVLYDTQDCACILWTLNVTLTQNVSCSTWRKCQHLRPIL